MKKFISVLAVLAVIGIAAVGAVFMSYNGDVKGGKGSSEEITVELEKGMGAYSVASVLAENGIVKNEKFRAQAVEKVVENARLFGLFSRGVTDSPIKGGDGNVEYLTVFDFNQSVTQGE